MSNPYDLAYPLVEDDGRGGQSVTQGLTKLEYFAARAPVMPADWFEPVMPNPRPATPVKPADLTVDEAKELEGLGEFYDAEHCEQPRIRAYGEACNAHRKAAHQWDKAKAIQRAIQWPRAWAEAVLETLP